MATCPTCGQTNAEVARFCFACGQLLAAGQPGAEERKVVSILFTDLVGFTSRSDQTDPEDVIATLRPYHALLKREIERFGGTVEKFIGDAVMAVFGAPVAHEDDPERAVRAALRITEAIAELNLERHEGLAVRSAVTSGEVVAVLEARPELGEGLVAGDVVNTAARLQQAAPTGGIVVDEATYRVIDRVIICEPLAPVSVKGKARPIAIWRAVQARGSYGVDVEHPRTPFVGRAEELALLRGRYERAIEGRTVQLVLITGEAGIGKTRLVSEFQTFVDQQPEIVWWRQGRCLPYGDGVTFWALGEVVKAHAGILGSDAPVEAMKKLDEAVATVSEEQDREWLCARLAPLVGLTSARQESIGRSESFTAWRTFLETLASDRPVVMVLEDLHWADPTFLEFVEDLVQFTADVPLLVVATARPELHERAPGWGSGRHNQTIVPLVPLSSDETSRLIASLPEHVNLPADTQALLLERAAGNPLYAEEFIRMLVDKDLLRRAGSTWVLSDGRPIPVPETVQALITSRLDALPTERKLLLQHAAIVGKVFWSGALTAIGNQAPSAVSEGLHDLARRELIYPARRTSVAGQDEYAFRHILIRDVAYGHIPRTARAAGHRAAARWIEDMAGDRVADYAELLVEHYERALDRSDAISADERAELRRMAARSLALAGDKTSQLDLKRSYSHYRRALVLVPQADPDRPDLLVRTGVLALYQGLLPEAKDLFEEALGAFRDAGSVEGEAWALAKLRNTVWRMGDGARGEELMHRMIELADLAPASPRMVEVHREIAGIFMLITAQPREGVRRSERALEMAQRFGLAGEAAAALNFRGTCRCDLGDRGGLDDLRESLRRSLEGGFAREATLAYENLGFMLSFIEGPTRALETLREGAAFGQSRGLLTDSIGCRGESIAPLYDLGRWDELLRTADEVTDWDRSRGGSYNVATVLPSKAAVLLYRGASEDVRSMRAELLGVAKAIGDPQFLIPALTVSALIDSSGGERAAAADLITQIEDITAERSPGSPRHILDCLRVLFAAGEVDRAATFLARAEARWGYYDQWIPSAEAVLAEATDDLRVAADRYREAASRWHKFGNVVEEALADLGLGRCLLRVGQDSDAHRVLTEARRTFAKLRAAALLTEADALTTRL